MKRCIDTCAYSVLMQGNPRLQKCMEESDILILPVVVLGELYTGFLAGSKTVENENRLEAFLEAPSVRVQEVTRDIARRYAIIVNALKKAGTPLPTNDIWIAATAMELGARLLSYDSHFSNIPGLIVEAP